MAGERKVRADALRSVARAVLVAGGSCDAEAECVAANLVEANLTGHDSHGVGLIPRYVRAVLDDDLRPNQHPGIVHDTGVLLRVDGHLGYGQAIGREAMELGIARAARHGVCVMGIANSGHLGRIGQWAEQCVAADLVSIHFVNVLTRPLVAPWGGRDARFGTNPFCVGIPRPGHPPIILDFATGKIAQGKARVAHNKGERLPLGTVLDDRGEPTTDPRWAVVPPYGAILPFGEHKGYGLALACELLAGGLAGGHTWRGGDHGKARLLNGMLSIILDPDHLGTRESFHAESQAFIEWVTQSPLAAGVERIQLAGDPERAHRRKRLAEGIPIDASTWREILAAGARLGVAADTLNGLAEAPAAAATTPGVDAPR